MQYFLFYNGLANTTGVKGSILATSGTFFVIIFARTVYPEDRLNRNKIIGLLLGALGIFMVNWTTDMASSLTLDFNFFGEGFIILTGISSAMATLIAKKLSAENSSFHLTFWQMLIGSILLLAVGIIGGGGFDLQFTPLAAVLLIYSAFASGVAFTIWYELLQYHDASQVTVYKFLIPVFGSILSILFLPGESFQIFIVLGLVSAALGIYFVNKPKKNI
jgi:drug/metabolite transporter (DMT)-like permease